MIEIRDARKDEFDELGHLRVAAYLADGFLSPESTYAPRLRALGADGLDQVLVAVETDDAAAIDVTGLDSPAGPGDARIVGTVMLQGWPQGGEILSGPDEAEIRALAVAPDARGKGIGRELLNAVIERATDTGIRHLLLLTQTEMKAAHHLYEQAGFSRLPDRDVSPVPGLLLLAFGLVLGGSSSATAGCAPSECRT